jgi:hypothetical protein
MTLECGEEHRFFDEEDAAVGGRARQEVLRTLEHPIPSQV